MEDVLSAKQKFDIIGNSPLLNNAIRVAMQVSNTDMTVLITGESGVGKESFSKIIHTLSRRRHGNLIAVNCGAIPEGTIDSELFGHEKGAFTGASEARKGYFEVTDGGTLFLDEIGEMPLGTQARLLRVLENGEYIRVGSSDVRKTDVRVVAATNVQLENAVQKGEFREDLYYRLNTVPIYVPPLRERGEDVALLFRKFASDFSEKYKMPPIMLDDDAQRLLLAFPFPGNVRQLKNLVEKISVLEGDNRFVNGETLQKYLKAPHPKRNLPALLDDKGDSTNFSEREILYKILFDLKKDVSDLKGLVFKLMQNNPEEATRAAEDFFRRHENGGSYGGEEASFLLETLNPTATSQPYEEEAKEEFAYAPQIQDITPEAEEIEQQEESLSLEQKEREMIARALEKNNNRRKKAAKDLGISERTLYRKIKQYGLD